MTLLLEDAPIVLDETKNDPKDPSKVKHYFRKDQFDDNLFNGSPMVALCGYVKVGPPKDISNLPVCQECAELMENVVGSNLPPEDRD
jgi:hypothetical protein